MERTRSLVDGAIGRPRQCGVNIYTNKDRGKHPESGVLSVCEKNAQCQKSSQFLKIPLEIRLAKTLKVLRFQSFHPCTAWTFIERCLKNQFCKRSRTAVRFVRDQKDDIGRSVARFFHALLFCPKNRP
jgi:hypothetical protein